MKLLSIKSSNLIVALTSIAGILVSALVLVCHRARYDPGLWLWTAVLIGVVAVIAIPLTIWHQRAVAAGSLPRAPWPKPSAPQDPWKSPPPSDLCCRGSFTWTVPEFVHMRNAWSRYSPAGRNHRRMLVGLSAAGFSGMGFALFWLSQGLLLAGTFLVVSAVLLAFVFACRIRPPDEVRSNAQVSWELSPDGIFLQSGGAKKELHWGSIFAVLRTSDGFLIWSDHLNETWLPLSSFGRPGEIELFSEVAASQVRNYVDRR